MGAAATGEDSGESERGRAEVKRLLNGRDCGLGGRCVPSIGEKYWECCVALEGGRGAVVDVDGLVVTVVVEYDRPEVSGVLLSEGRGAVFEDDRSRLAAVAEPDADEKDAL